MMKIFPFFLLLIFIFSAHSANIDHNDDFPFERKVWSFWDADDFSQAPIIVQACYEKIKMSAQKAGFEYILLNSKNLPQYISNYEEKILKVREKSYQEGLPAFADLVRMNVIHEHGGIWMDITEVLIDDFDWLVNIKAEKYRNLITNRFSEEPDALFFYYPNFQNSAQHRIPLPNDKNQSILYNQIPAFEAWFFAAKKNSPLIGQITKVYTRFTQMPYQKLFRLFIEQQIYMHNQDGIGYLTINYAISYVLQKKQKQLDKSISLFGTRPSVYEFYNLWGLSGFLGPQAWTNDEAADIIHLMDRPNQYFQKRGWIINFFVKIVGHFKQQFTKKLSLLHNIFTEYEGQFQKFMQSKPSQSTCIETYFLVQGSLLHKLFTNTTYLQKQNIQVIKPIQNQKWQQYCLDKYNINKQFTKSNLFGSIVDSLLYLKVRQAVPWYKAHNTVNYGKDYSSNPLHKLKDWFFVNSASLGFWLKFLMDSASWFFVQFFIFKFLSKKYIKKPSSRNFQIHSNSENNRSHSQSDYVTSLAIILCNTVSLYEYHMVDYFGERDRPFETFVSVTFIFMLQNFIENRVTNDHGNQLCYDVAYPFITFRTTFTAFSLLRNNKNRLTFYSIMIGLAGPCLMRLYERMESQKTLGSFLSKTLYRLVDKKIHRKALVILLLCIWLVPNARYILIGDHYIMSFIPVILFILIVLIFIDILIESLRRKQKLQILRILLLGSLSVAIFYMVPIRNEVIEYNFHRVLWTFLAITVYQSVYVQIGNDYLINKDNEKRQSIIECYNKRKFEVLICLSLLSVQLVIGSFSWMVRIPFNDKLGYFQGLFLGFYNFLVAVYLHVQVMNQEKKPYFKDIGSMDGFEEIQMETEND